MIWCRFDNKWHHLDCALITPWPLAHKNTDSKQNHRTPYVLRNYPTLSTASAALVSYCRHNVRVLHLWSKSHERKLSQTWDPLKKNNNYHRLSGSLKHRRIWKFKIKRITFRARVLSSPCEVSDSFFVVRQTSVGTLGRPWSARGQKMLPNEYHIRHQRLFCLRLF